MRVLEFITDYAAIPLLIATCLLPILVIIRIAYKAVKYPRSGQARAAMRDAMNIYDPLTGVPRTVVGKEIDVAVIEEWKKQRI